MLFRFVLSQKFQLTDSVGANLALGSRHPLSLALLLKLLFFLDIYENLTSILKVIYLIQQE